MQRILSCLLVLIALPLSQAAPLDSLKTVKALYVGPMGQSDDAQRFRLLLAAELRKVGLATPDERSANAIMTGIFTMQVRGGNSTPFATLFLNTPDGNRIWSYNFEPRPFGLHSFSFRFGHRTRDAVKACAQAVTSMLQEDLSKAAKY